MHKELYAYNRSKRQIEGVSASFWLCCRERKRAGRYQHIYKVSYRESMLLYWVCDVTLVSVGYFMLTAKP